MSTNRRAGAQGISIHAPAKGATSFPIQSATIKAEFQSTLPRRERRVSGDKRQIAANYFNPRSREGSDRRFMWRRNAAAHFNPRSREGSDPSLRSQSAMTARFQSTLPRRERPSSFSAGTTILYFNPRSREGSDFTLQKKFLYTLTFQSTLPRRERPQELFHLVNLRNFNPRSREGSDLLV